MMGVEVMMVRGRGGWGVFRSTGRRVLLLGLCEWSHLMQYMGDDVMYLWDGYKVGCWGVLYTHGIGVRGLG